MDSKGKPTEEIELKDGEQICSECKGKGSVREVNDGGFIIRHSKCEKCHGYGKLDWIEMIVGKRGWCFKPGIYIKEVDISSCVPKFKETDEFLEEVEDLRKAIIDSCGIRPELLGIKEKK
jgi:hypothetical protein